jgi:ATP-dependent DNA helicase RecG
VALTLYGEIQDPQFLKFLEKVGKELQISFSTDDFLLLDLVHRGQTIPDELRTRVRPLIEQGLIETVSRGRGAYYMLSKRFYVSVGRKGAYTRRRGLDREANKALLIKHLEQFKAEGSQLRDIREALPHLSMGQVQTLLRELRREDKVHSVGRTNAGRWYLGPNAESTT